MHKKLFLAIFCCCLFKLTTVNAQQGHDPKLYATILHMDSVMFDAFNRRDLETLKTVFSSDLEFYQDRDGLGDYTVSMSHFKRLFEGTGSVKRELIPASVEIYAIPGYGAVEIGTHRFTRTENGESVASIYKFVLTWHYVDGQWKVARAISVGH